MGYPDTARSCTHPSIYMQHVCVCTHMMCLEIFLKFDTKFSHFKKVLNFSILNLVVSYRCEGVPARVHAHGTVSFAQTLVHVP